MNTSSTKKFSSRSTNSMSTSTTRRETYVHPTTGKRNFKYKKGSEGRQFLETYKRVWVSQGHRMPDTKFYRGKIYNPRTGKFGKRSTYLTKQGRPRAKYLRRGLIVQNDRIVPRPTTADINRPRLDREQHRALLGKVTSQIRQRRVRLEVESHVENKRYGTIDTTYKIAGYGLTPDAVMDLIVAKITGTRRYRVVFEFKGRIWSTKFNDASDVTKDTLLKLFAEKYQDLQIADLRVTIQSIARPTGGNYKPDPFLKGKKKVITPRNSDQSCGQTCIALALLDANFRKRYKAGTHSKKKLAKKVSEVSVILGEGQLTFDAFNKLGVYHRVIVIDKSLDVIWDTARESTDVSTTHGIEKTKGFTTTYLYWSFETEHYSLITNINSFTNEGGNYRWCPKCMSRHLIRSFHKHKCIKCKCQICHKEFDNEELRDAHFQSKSWVKCGVCNQWCPSQECLKRHQSCMVGIKNPKPLCDGTKWRCDKKGCCQRWMDNTLEAKAAHVCGKKCTNCGEVLPKKGEHRCFIQKLEKKEKKKPTTYFTYDLESQFVEGRHIVNYAVVGKLYSPEFCLEFTDIGGLVEWMLKQKNSTFIAHNAKAYDAWLIRGHLLKNTTTRPGCLIMAGNKIMMMRYKTLSWVDSLNHVASGLSKLPKIFGMDESEFKKGFFPYKFNTPENQNYVGRIPSRKYFEPHRMMPKKRREFLEWYKAQRGEEYDFQKELREYCKSDVKILTQAMEIYRDNAIAFNDGLDPLECCTIASYCMKVFRTNHLVDSKTIAILTRVEWNFIKRAFFGGRTNAVKFYHKVCDEDLAKGICLRYKDIQSLYPAVQFYDDMPVGAPEWVDVNGMPADVVAFCRETFGYIEVDITQPNDLYHPVLAERKDGKLIFDLVTKKKAVYCNVDCIVRVFTCLPGR